LPGEDFSLEERLRRLESLLNLVLRTLERIEGMLAAPEPEEARVARRLVMLFSLPVGEAIRAAREVVEATRGITGLTALDIIVLEAVASMPGASLRDLERAIRRARGRASRETIKRSLERLKQLGLVRVEYDGRRYRVSLASRER